MKAKRIMVPAVALIVAIILGACGTDSTSGAGDPTGTPTPTPTTVTHDETEWSIKTPSGWTRGDITKDADAKKAIRYSAADGNYFIVAIDPTGSGIDSDAVWRYEVAGQGFRVVERQECTGGTDAGCSAADDRYDVYLAAKSTAEPPKVAGHVWYFLFGDSTGTQIDQALFDQIIASITVK